MNRLLTITVLLLLMLALITSCQPEKTAENEETSLIPTQSVIISEPLGTRTTTEPLTLEITSSTDKETEWGFTTVRGIVSHANAVVSIENEGYVSINLDGSFESDSIVLNEGKNEIRVTATNGKEEVSKDIIVNYTLKLHVSLSLGYEPGKDWLTESPARIGGRVSDSHAEVTINGQKPAVGNDGYILITMELAGGMNVLTAVATVGGQTATDTREVVYKAPVPLTKDKNTPDGGHGAKADMVKITGKVSDPEAHVMVNNMSGGRESSSVFFNFAPVKITASGIFYAHVPLEKGTNHIEATAFRGNDRVTNKFDIEYAPPLLDFSSKPELTITSPLNGSEYKINVLPVTGTVDDPNAIVLVNGIEALVSSDGSFQGCVVLDSAPLNSDTGEYTVEVIALNDTRKDAKTIHVKFTPPLTVSLNAESQPGVDYSKESMTVSGMVNKPEANVKVNGKNVPVSESGFFRTQVTLKEGNNRISAVATLGDETDEMYILNFIQDGVLGVVPGYSGFFSANFRYESEIMLKAGQTFRLPATLETNKDGPGGFSGSFVYVDEEYGTMPLPWPEGLEIYLEPSSFTAYPNATYDCHLVVSAAADLSPGIYYLHFSQIFENGFYGSGWIKVTVE